MNKRIILADDENLFREGLKRILIEFGEFEFVGEASNGKELLQVVRTTPEFELIILDLSMPVMDGITTLKELMSINAEMKVAILSSHYDPALIVKMIELGAASFFAKNEKPKELIEGLNTIINMGFHYSPFIIQLLRDKMIHGDRYTMASDLLSDREKEVLQKLCEQKTAKEIGKELFISSRTVEGHRNHLLEKTNSKNIAGLIIYAIENGIYKVEIDDLMQRIVSS
ncbi:response regulator transcription factor [Portibacter marinus]|uniref:response regulator transcription factor n=1 Tax=Portibacter marinus TaxID=2898660 RepID=UPI001F48BFD3|nr:response regulator transcription factor [Portibacter marinus]